MRYAIFLVLLFCSATAGADVYKCLTPSGEAFFSDSPCEKGKTIEQTRPSESVSDPDAARQEVERQRAYVERQAAENEAAKRAAPGVAQLPGESSPPPSWPEPRPLSPSSTVTRGQ